MVFAFLGDLPEAERPPLYEVPEYGQPTWKSQTYVLNLGAYYREHCKEWENRGWRVDMKASRGKQGDVAFAVPLMPGRSSASATASPAIRSA